MKEVSGISIIVTGELTRWKAGLTHELESSFLVGLIWVDKGAVTGRGWSVRSFVPPRWPSG